MTKQNEMNKMNPIVKNRDRSAYSFANINLLGRCNLDCLFCLGKDLAVEFSQYNQLATPARELPRIDEFLAQCAAKGIENIYVTGQNTDSLLYRDLDSLVDLIQDGHGLKAGLRTNGLLAKRRLETINRCKKSISYTLLSQDKETMKRITGVPYIPDFDFIFNHVTIPQRVATVVTTHNVDEILDLVEYVSHYPQVGYFQVRRISTDTRYDAMREHIEAFDSLLSRVESTYPRLESYEHAPRFQIHGIPVSFWKTVETTANSLNYFSNGVISDEYFIIEGYQKYHPDFQSDKHSPVEKNPGNPGGDVQ